MPPVPPQIRIEIQYYLIDDKIIKDGRHAQPGCPRRDRVHPLRPQAGPPRDHQSAHSDHEAVGSPWWSGRVRVHQGLLL